jgi:O-antigen/teichoic acid export membrane protein
MSEPRSREPRAGEPPSRSHVERRFVANSGLIIAARVVTAGLSIVTIPVLVARFGVGGYGTWEALLALASLASIFHAAIGGTLVWRVSEAHGRGDLAEIRRLTRLGAGAAWALFMSLWPLAWVLRHAAAGFLGVAPETRAVVADMFPVVAALVLLAGLSDTLEAVVSGCQRTGLVAVAGAAAQILNYSVVIVFVVLGGGLWSLVAGQAVGFAARLGGAWAATRVAYGTVSLVPALPSRRDVVMVRYSGLLTVSSVAAALRDQADKIILASLASPTWVGYYGMASRLSGLLLEILRPLYAPLLTAAGVLKGMGDWVGVRLLYGRAMAIVSVLTGMVVVVLGGLADYLLVLWVGHPIPQVTWLLWLLMTGTAAAAMLTGPGTAVCRGCGRAGVETAYLALNLVLNLAATVALVLLIGPIGTALATGLTWAVSSVGFLLVLHRRLDLPSAPGWRAALAAAIAAGVAAATYWATRWVGLPGGRVEALWSVAWLGATSAASYLALVLSFRLVSAREGYRSVRALLGRIA